MTKKYKILGKYIKDLSSETKDIETYLFVKENISKYQLGIDITSQALKNKMIDSIAKLCEVSKNQINIKGKTTEKLGVIGKEKAIACEVITSVIKYD